MLVLVEMEIFQHFNLVLFYCTKGEHVESLLFTTTKTLVYIFEKVSQFIYYELHIVAIFSCGNQVLSLFKCHYAHQITME